MEPHDDSWANMCGASRERLALDTVEMDGRSVAYRAAVYLVGGTMLPVCARNISANANGRLHRGCGFLLHSDF